LKDWLETKKSQCDVMSKMIFHKFLFKNNQAIDASELKENEINDEDQKWLKKPIPTWLKWNHLDNLIEDNLSRLHYRSVFFHYVKLSGYSEIVFNESPETLSCLI